MTAVGTNYGTICNYKITLARTLRAYYCITLCIHVRKYYYATDEVLLAGYSTVAAAESV